MNALRPVQLDETSPFYERTFSLSYSPVEILIMLEEQAEHESLQLRRALFSRWDEANRNLVNLEEALCVV